MRKPRAAPGSSRCTPVEDRTPRSAVARCGLQSAGERALAAHRRPRQRGRVLGWLAVGGIAVVTLVFCRELLLRLGEARWSMASGLALCAATASVAWCTPLTGSATTGPWLLGAVSAVGVVRSRWGARARSSPAASAAPSAWALGLGGAGAVLVAWTALGTCLWDEVDAHFGLVAVVARGIVPPVHPLFPFHAFRYHYGFDLLAGAVRALSGTGVDHAIDAVALGTYASLLALAAAAGAALAGRRGASFALVLVPLGSGIGAVILSPELPALMLGGDVVPLGWRFNAPPPVISNFFQHPQGLGMPIALFAALISCREAGSAAQLRASRALGAFALGVLSLAQIVFFAVLGLALATAAVTRGVAAVRGGATVRTAIAALIFDAACLLGALLVGWSLGGFFLPVGQSAGDTFLFGRTYFDEAPLPAILHHLVVFGLPLLAVPAALLARGGSSSLRHTLIAAAVIAFAVPNIVIYRQSWDIVKFFGVAAFFANLLLADVAARALPARAPWSLGVVALSIPAAVLWLGQMTVFPALGLARATPYRPPTGIGDAVARALPLEPNTRVLSSSVDLAMGAGLLTPGFSPRDYGDGYLMDRPLAARLEQHQLRARRDLAREDLDALGVTFVALAPEELDALSPAGRARVMDPHQLTPLGVAEADGQRRRLFAVTTTTVAR